MRQKHLITIVGTLLLLTIIIPCEATTWSVNIIRFTDQMGYDGFPAVTQMSDGKIWLVWSKAIMGNLTLFYKNSSDLGATWSSESNLTEVLTPGNNQNPTIIQAQNGTIWIAWASDRPPTPQPPSPDFYMNATPTSLTILPGSNDNSTISVTGINNFTDTVTISASSLPNVTTILDPTQVFIPTNGTATSNLTVSVSPEAALGNYTLTVTGYSPAEKIFRTVDVALEITDSIAVSSSNPSHTQSLSSTPKQIQDYEIYFKTSHDNGATWSDNIQLTDDSADDLWPSIVQLSNGTIMLVWQSNIMGNHDIFYMTTPNGTVWSNAKQLTTDPERDTGAHVTQTSNGDIWVVWASRRTGEYEIYSKIYACIPGDANGDGYVGSADFSILAGAYGTSVGDPAYDERADFNHDDYIGSADFSMLAGNYGTMQASMQWSNDNRLTFSSTTSDMVPSILQDIEDTIWIFWTSSPTTGDTDIYYMASFDNGNNWSASTLFTADDNEDMWPAIFQTRDTKIWVVWTSNRGDQPEGNWDVYFKTSLAGDVNDDGSVDVFDLSIVEMAYGTFDGMPGYNPDADINKDGLVDMRDLAIVTLYFGET